MKFPPPPAWMDKVLSWRGLQMFQIACTVLCLGLAVGSGLSIAGMIDMFLAGANAAGAFYSGRMVRTHRSFEKMSECFNEMVDLNRALVENRVKLHIAGISSDDDSPPIQPRFH